MQPLARGLGRRAAPSKAIVGISMCEHRAQPSSQGIEDRNLLAHSLHLRWLLLRSAEFRLT